MNSRKDEQGAIAILVALFAVAMFIVAALVVDLGMARDTRQSSQNAADASALAAANLLYPDGSKCSDGSATPCIADAVAAAKSYAAVNFGVTAAEWGSCPSAPAGYTVPTGAPSCIAFDSLTKPTKVWAVMPTRDVKTGLGALAGVNQIPVGSRAQARVASGLSVKCSLCFLGDLDSGNADYTVSGGSIAVAGDVSLGPNGNVTATGGGAVAVGGTYNPNESFSPKPVIDIDAFPDPLASMSLPVGKAGLTAKSQPCKKNSTTPGDGPGIYGDVAISGDCQMEPGLYIIVGQWSLKNNDVLSNKPGGVTLYFTCGTTSAPTACASTGQAGGQLFGKNGSIDVSARSVDPINGFAIVYDRHNTSSLQLQGNGRGSIVGGVYAASSALEYNGNSCFTISGGPVVVDSVVKANGNKACVSITNAKQLGVAELPGDIGLEQ